MRINGETMKIVTFTPIFDDIWAAEQAKPWILACFGTKVSDMIYRCILLSNKESFIINISNLKIPCNFYIDCDFCMVL